MQEFKVDGNSIHSTYLFFPLKTGKRPSLTDPKDTYLYLLLCLSMGLHVTQGTRRVGGGLIIRTLEEEGSHVKWKESLASSLFQVDAADGSTGPQNTISVFLCVFFFLHCSRWLAGRKEPNIPGRATHSPHCQLPPVLTGKRQDINKFNLYTYICCPSFLFSKLPTSYWCPCLTESPSVLPTPPSGPALPLNVRPWESHQIPLTISSPGKWEGFSNRSLNVLNRTSISPLRCW